MLQLLTSAGPRPIEAFLFDMDGTMVDSRPFHLEAWSQLVKRHSPHFDRDTIIRKTFGLSNRQIIPLLTDKLMELHEIDALSEEKEALYRRLAHGRVRAIPGLLDLVRRATYAGVRLAIASSAILPNVRFILEEFHLQPYFCSIAHAGRVHKGKPDPETMLLAAQDLAVLPSRCAVFEDAPAGLEAAKRAGMTAIAVETHPQDSLRQWADLTVPDFHSVLARLV